MLLPTAFRQLCCNLWSIIFKNKKILHQSVLQHVNSEMRMSPRYQGKKINFNVDREIEHGSLCVASVLNREQLLIRLILIIL